MYKCICSIDSLPLTDPEYLAMCDQGKNARMFITTQWANLCEALGRNIRARYTIACTALFLKYLYRALFKIVLQEAALSHVMDCACCTLLKSYALRGTLSHGQVIKKYVSCLFSKNFFPFKGRVQWEEMGFDNSTGLALRKERICYF